VTDELSLTPGVIPHDAAVLQARCAAAASNEQAAVQRLHLLARRAAAGDAYALMLLPAAQDHVLAAGDRREAALDRCRAARHLESSQRDSLTGALQRGAGVDRLERLLAGRRGPGHRVVVAFLDVDGLKSVNDERGHLAGDELLRCLGAALLASLRADDLVIRWGGDEFVCALDGVSLRTAADRFRATASLLASSWPGASVSTGLCLAEQGASVEQVLRRADSDLYRRRALIRSREHARSGT
jgi:diguanylate cyclase (GGDEF)-like protein